VLLSPRMQEGYPPKSVSWTILKNDFRFLRGKMTRISQLLGVGSTLLRQLTNVESTFLPACILFS